MSDLVKPGAEDRTAKREDDCAHKAHDDKPDKPQMPTDEIAEGEHQP